MGDNDLDWKVERCSIYDEKGKHGRPCYKWSDGLGHEAMQLLGISKW